MAARFVLLDIEGTTTPIRFVKNTLFPFAAQALPGFLRTHHRDPEVREHLASVSSEADLEGRLAILLRWIDEDRKESALKALQGMVWREGYEDGRLTGQVYPDVPGAFRRWRERGLGIGIYSSGSVEAQKLLFRHAQGGDLSPYLSAFFDTRVGLKAEPTSYRTIASQLGRPPKEVLFASDVEAELDAAVSAGFEAVQVVRPEDGTVPSSKHPTVPDVASLPV
ncbi:MAG: acireductone synthase [Myxococcota bacterium]